MLAPIRHWHESALTWWTYTCSVKVTKKIVRERERESEQSDDQWQCVGRDALLLRSVGFTLCSLLFCRMRFKVQFFPLFSHTPPTPPSPEHTSDPTQFCCRIVAHLGVHHIIGIPLSIHHELSLSLSLSLFPSSSLSFKTLSSQSKRWRLWHFFFIFGSVFGTNW